MIGHGNRVRAPHAVLAFNPAFSTVMGLVSADPGAREKRLQPARMARYPVHVPIHAALFMLSHFIGHNPGGIVDLWKGSRTRRPADIFPSRAAIAAARYAALFDADDDFIGHAGIERNAPCVRHVSARWKSPLVIIRQIAKRRKLAERPAAVFADEIGRPSWREGMYWTVEGV